MLNYFLLNFFLAPHGITDLIYAYKINNLSTLFYYYFFCMILTNKIYHKNKKILFYLFYLISNYHFRNDFNNQFISIILFNLIVKNSIVRIKSEYIINPNLFILYMSFFHVYNHYKKSWYFIKNCKLFSIILIILNGFMSDFIFKSIKKNPNKIKYIIGIILAHISYSEKYIRY